MAFDFDPSGTQWIQVWQQDFGAPFQQFATGDLNGDGDDELAGIRNVPAVSIYQLVIWDPSASWSILYEGNYSIEWTALAIGNTHADPSGSDELVLSRNPGMPSLNSYKVFRCCEETSLVELDTASYLPPYTSLATGDVNGSGDEEVYLLRSGMAGSQPVVALTSRNYGSDFRYSSTTCLGKPGIGRSQPVISTAMPGPKWSSAQPTIIFSTCSRRATDRTRVFRGCMIRMASSSLATSMAPMRALCGPIYLPIVLKP